MQVDLFSRHTLAIYRCRGVWCKRGRLRCYRCVHRMRGEDWRCHGEEISFGRRLQATQGVTLHGLPAFRVCSGRQRGRRFHSQHCVSLSLTHPLSLC